MWFDSSGLMLKQREPAADQHQAAVMFPDANQDGSDDEDDHSPNLHVDRVHFLNRIHLSSLRLVRSR